MMYKRSSATDIPSAELAGLLAVGHLQGWTSRIYPLLEALS